MVLEYTDLSSIPNTIMRFAGFLADDEQQRARNLSSAYDSLGQTGDELLSMVGRAEERLSKTRATANLISDIKTDFASGDYASSLMKFSVAKDLYKNNPTFKSVVDENMDISATYISINDAFQYNVALDKGGQNLVNLYAIYNNRGKDSIYEDVKKILPTIAGDEQRMSFLRFVGLPPEVVAYDSNSGTTLATPVQVKNGLLAYKGSLQTGEPYRSSYEKVSLGRFGGLPAIQGLVNEIDFVKDTDPVTAYVLARRYEQPDLQNDMAYLIGANQDDPERVKELLRLMPSSVRNDIISSKISIDDKTYPVTEALAKAKMDSSFRSKLMSTVSDDYKVLTANGLRDLGIDVSPDDVAGNYEQVGDISANLETDEGMVIKTISSGLSPNVAIGRVLEGNVYKETRSDINEIINPNVVTTESGRSFVKPTSMKEDLSNLYNKIPNLQSVLENDSVLASGITNPELKPKERGQYLGVAIARAKSKTEEDTATTMDAINSVMTRVVQSGESSIPDPRNPDMRISAAEYLSESVDSLMRQSESLKKFNSKGGKAIPKYVGSVNNFIRSLDSQVGSRAKNRTSFITPPPIGGGY